MKKKRITIDISEQAFKILTMQSIDQNTKIKLLIESEVEKKAKRLINKESIKN